MRNVQGIDATTGEYTGVVAQFHVSEDFWTRDCPQHHLMQAFQQGHYWVYVNGFAAGRMSFVMLQQVLNQAYWTIWRNPWNNPNWGFRPPRSLEETKALVKLNVQAICTLFQLSDYSAPYIGGNIQMHLIPQPLNTATSC